MRTASDADADCILRIVHQAFEQYRGTLYPPSGAHAETHESILAKLGSGGAFLATEDALPVGCALWKAEPSYMYLGRLAVLAGRRRCGVGRALMDAVEARARQMGLGTMQLGVRLGIPGLQDYYARLGYHVHHFGSHPGFSEPTYVMMRKDLSEPTGV